MTRTLQERAVDAAAAYLERVGMTDVMPDDHVPDVLFATDGDTAVLAVVFAHKTMEEEVVFTDEHMRLYQAIAATVKIPTPDWPVSKVRFDLIDILVVAEDRALLRHIRAAGMNPA